MRDEMTVYHKCDRTWDLNAALGARGNPGFDQTAALRGEASINFTGKLGVTQYRGNSATCRQPNRAISVLATSQYGPEIFGERENARGREGDGQTDTSLSACLPLFLSLSRSLRSVSPLSLSLSHTHTHTRTPRSLSLSFFLSLSESTNICVAHFQLTNDSKLCRHLLMQVFPHVFLM